jgi:hypothetical protein
METLSRLVKTDYREVSVAYADGFERAFPINTFDGNLLCTNDQATSDWYNSQLEFMGVFLGFEPPSLNLAELPRRDVQLTRAYALAYLAYCKVCNLFARTKNPLYTQWLYVDCGDGGGLSPNYPPPDYIVGYSSVQMEPATIT